MSKKRTICLLVLIGCCQLASIGCVSHKAAETMGAIVAAKAIEMAIEPAFELAFATEKFQEKNGRWPNDFAELRSFVVTEKGASLTNYDRVDFTPKSDGSVAVLAIGAGITNQMTLTAPKKSED